MNVITFFVLRVCVLSYDIFKLIFQRKKIFQTFKEKLQKKITKMKHVIIHIQPDLPVARATIHEKNSRNWLLQPKLWCLIVRFFLDVFFGLCFKHLCHID